MDGGRCTVLETEPLLSRGAGWGECCGSTSHRALPCLLLPASLLLLHLLLSAAWPLRLCNFSVTGLAGRYRHLALVAVLV